VDFLQATGSDTIRPFRDSPLEVRRRWYPVPEGTPLLGVPSAFLSARYQAFPWFARNVGEVYPSRWVPVKNPTPPGLTFDHVCGTPDDFAIGQVFDATLDVDYDVYWIPTCCGRVTMCENEECGSAPVNGADAAQHYTYPIRATDATDTTPVVISQVALNQGNHVPSWPGTLTGYYPNGRTGDASASQLQVSDDAGNLQFQTETIRFTTDTAVTQEWSLAGYSVTAELGGASGQLALNIIGGQLVIGGSNAQVAKSILPPDTFYRDALALTGTGTTQGTARRLNDGSAIVTDGGAGNDAFILPADAAGVVDVRSRSNSTLRVFPPVGEVIGIHAVDAAFFLPPITASDWVYRFTRGEAAGATPATWWVDVYDPKGALPTSGTVTSVSIATTSTGLTVGVATPTTTPALTVNLAVALQDVVAMAAVAGIIAGDGAGGLLTVTISDYLTYSAGTLKVVPPTATSGQLVCAGFVITGATGVYQATGNTFALPTAGTYLVTGRVRAGLVPGAATSMWVKVKLRNNTLGADVASSETVVVWSSANGIDTRATAGFTAVVTVGGATTCELYAARVTGPWSYSAIESDAEGRTVLDWMKLSN
jgi:hypothetical protein